MTATTTERKLRRRPTPAQVRAARALVRWADEKGEGTVDEYVRAIASYRLDSDESEPAGAQR